MLKIISLLILLLSAHYSKAQNDHQNINFLGVFNDTNVLPEPQYGIRYQACWGWADSSNGKEYGIIGSTAGTYIVEVTDPTNPVQCDYIPQRRNNCIWHEYKTYQNYLYIISDDSGNNSFQIADLSYLPDSAHVIYDSTDIFVHAHTLSIDRDKLYVASVTSSNNYSSMNVYSLSNPIHPTLLRRLDQDFPFINSVHDMFVINDTVYASCGYDGLFIFKYDTIANQFILLGTLQDGFNNYNHSSVLSPDHKILYLCEEVPDGRPVKIIDVSDIGNPSLVNTFFSNTGATPHNPIIKDNMLIIAYYQDGVYKYDITNPETPVSLGFYDTYPTNPPGSYLQPTYSGSWSAYADLPSGILLTGDTQFGLFCLDMSVTNGIKNPIEDEIKIYPNPAKNQIQVSGVNNSSVMLLDLSGRICWIAKKISGDLQVDLSNLAKGIYFIKISGNEKVKSRKVIVE